MSKVRKWDGEGTFAGSRGNDGVAPQRSSRQSGAATSLANLKRLLLHQLKIVV